MFPPIFLVYYNSVYKRDATISKDTGKTYSCMGLDKLQESEAPNRHMKVAQRTGRLYPRRYPWYSFLLEAESTPGP